MAMGTYGLGSFLLNNRKEGDDGSASSVWPRPIWQCLNEEDAARAVREYAKEQEIAEVPICDMNRAAGTLEKTDGTKYKEISESVWMACEGGRIDVAYLHTGRHGGGIVLRPLYLLIDGVWRNATTGKEAPRSLPLPGRD